ncbi:SusC/RagA family TonB-linked outer membrane protein [Parapedobacter tibetensis]|uniref:SusC/RagA family TonB-linked outer membrane protein n=1 Tax=Parapedobacter tibetensis TaxID=2972951 RepID=UPI00214DE8F0|nr:SusC/RagA family TonB-linked outer membrane protein [Parapedobacter tibetensis]
MKYKNKVIRLAMRTFLFTVAMLTCIQLIWADRGNAQALNGRINIGFHDESLSDALLRFGKSVSVQIAYDAKALDMNNYTVQARRFEDTEASAILAYLLNNTAITYIESDAGLVLVSKENVKQMGRIEGQVVDGDQVPLAGATIRVVELGRTAATDQYGRYSIAVQDGTYTVQVSYLAYGTQRKEQVAVSGGRSVTVNFELVSTSDELNEVVVTALGIKREERSLGYAVGRVKGEDLNRVANENVLTGIAGRVPGVAISATGGTGSSVSMVIRGATSLNNDNQPLFVIDGVPVGNTLNNIGQIGSDNRVDYGNAIASLNPDDIDEISILKGPSAAALYGSRAGNGVVLITTKSGKDVNKMTISVNSNTVFDVPYKFLDMHSKFATGVIPLTPDNPIAGGGLIIEEGSAAGMGPELDKGYLAVQWNSPVDENGNKIPTPLVSHPNNVRNFVQTGITSTNGISIASNNDRMDYRISYANMSNRGIIPNSDLFRNSLNINSAVELYKDVSLSAQVDFSRNNSNNRPATNRGANPMEWAYKVSPHINILDLRNYWVDGYKDVQQLSQAPDDYNNPYFLAYEVNNAFVRDRVFGNLKAEWQITPEFNFMARYALDLYSEERESKVPYSYTNEPRGAYGIVNLRRQEQNIDVLALYRKSFSAFSLLGSVGGNLHYRRNRDVQTKSKNEAGLITPGLYTLSNIAPTSLDFTSYLSERAVNSVYGLLNVGYRDMVYLDLTARNDWSSTLPEDNRSYFYPSASLSVLLDKALNLPNDINLLKIRGGIAQVGNDTEPHRLMNVLSNAGVWGGNVIRMSKSGELLIPNLKPEKATSFEAGIDVSALQNRLRLEANYYKVENENQIIPITLPGSSGFSSININAGLLSSRGVEVVLGGTPVKTANWMWDVNLNWSRNRTRIDRLSDGMEFFPFWTEGRGGARTYVGEEIGDLYDSKLVTVEDKNSPYYGFPILNEQGSWQAIRINNTRNKIGNFNPDFVMGMQTALSYKRFTLHAALDMRFGGDFMSQTYRYSESDLKTQRFLDNLIHPNGLSGQALRDYLVNNDLVQVKGNSFNIVGGPTVEYGAFPLLIDGVYYGDFAVFNPGVIAQYNDAGEIVGYTENLGGEGTKYIPYANNYPWDFMLASTFDASYIKLRELSLAYALPVNFTRKLGMQNASVSVYTRNIILWTKAKIGVDPEMAFQQESSRQGGGGTQFKQGIERYNVTPWAMPIGFRLAVTF